MARNRKWIYIAGTVIVLILIAIAVVPSLIDANQYRPRIEAALSSSLNRKVEIGNIKLSVFAGGISVENVAIADDPAFSTAPFLTAKSLVATVDLMPLIFSHALHITGLTIDQPRVTLLRSVSGTWNFSTLGASESKPAANAAPPANLASSANSGNSNTDISVQTLTIKNGTISVGDAGAKTKKHEYDQVALSASDLSYTTQFPFELTATTPGNGDVKLTGKAGPLNRTDAEQTPLDASLRVQNLDLRSTGFTDPSSGIAGFLDFDGTVTSDGQRINSKGKVNASKLQLVQGSSPATQPIQIDYDADYGLKPQTGALKQGDVHIGKALARLAGTYSTAGETTSVQMKLTGDNMPATDLESMLPAVGVILPSGASVREGSLNANLAITGPVDRLVTSGPINLSNAKLAGFDLGGKMGALGSFAGLPKGSDTVIQTLSSNVRVAPEGIRADNLNLVVPAIGTLTGSGTIAANHALDFKMLAHLTASSGALGTVAKLSLIGGQSGSGGGIPFQIQGTTSNPVFVPDVKGMVGGIARGAVPGVPAGIPKSGQDLGNALGGLFGKKKSQ